MNDDVSNELQREALGLLNQYGFYRHFLPAPAKSFLAKLADYLNWQDLKKEL